MKCAACGTDSTTASSLRHCSRCHQVAYCSKECQTSHWADHKDDCIRQNYIIRCQLLPADPSISWRFRASITDPPVERTLSCPANATFDQLHVALQVAFGWSATHTYDFSVLDPDFKNSTDATENPILDMVQRFTGTDESAPPREYILRVMPKNVSPMEYLDAMHNHERQHPNTCERNSTAMKLYQLLDDAKYRDEKLVYTYDLGNRWEHLLAVIGREAATRRFRCIEGSGHGVAEDVKPTGWAELKAAYRSDRPNEDQREKRQWYERTCSNGESQGLGGGKEHAFDLPAVNSRLSVRTI